MRRRTVMNVVLAGMIVCGGVAVVETVQIGSTTRSPAASAADALSASPDPPPPSALPPPSPVVVPAAMPTTIAVHAQGRALISPTAIDQNQLRTGSDGRVKPGDKPGLYVADRVSTLPGSDQGTVIIGGHAKASNDMVFNPLMQLGESDLNHARVVLELPGGELTYTIEAIYIVDKVGLPQQRALVDNRPGRVLLITCDVENGNDTFQNLIVAACDESHQGCGAA